MVCTVEFPAVELALASDKTIAEVARDLGVSPEGLRAPGVGCVGGLAESGRDGGVSGTS